MPAVRDLLARFRPAAELAPVFAALAATVAEADRLRRAGAAVLSGAR